jgi:hypothetical protein
MSGDHEARALHNIEQHLTDEDPEFATRMRGPETGPRPFPTVFALCVLLYICLPIEALLFGWISALVTLAVVTGAVIITHWLSFTSR